MTLTGSNKNELLEIISLSSDSQSVINNAIFNTSDGELLEIAYAEQLEAFQEVGKRRDIDCILAGEKIFLQVELYKFADSPSMKSSLKEGLNDIKIIDTLLLKVRNPDEYKSIDDAHIRAKSRRNGLPDDDARKSFRSHATRLINLDRGRMDKTERSILDQRRKNIMIAEKAYIALQEAALGKAETKGDSISMGMDL